MKTSFEIEITKITEVVDVPHSWSDEQYLELLEKCDVDDIKDIPHEEVRDYALLALQDLEPDEAAERLLQTKLGDKLSQGKIENLAQEMKNERVWEEYVDISMHEKLYHCASPLYMAFPRKVSEADARFCSLKINPQTPYSAKVLSDLDESMLTRMLADGMSDHSILNRFFNDKLVKGPFNEAEHIVWQYEVINSEALPLSIELYTSAYWLGDLTKSEVYVSNALSDKSS
ncbi:MAG: hypothetical protein RIF33_07925 [Cyclobacteriaceae bacterium]